MKAITICQPHAWAVVYGNKYIENRTWPSSYRGPLLIHAGKSKEYLDSGGYPDQPDDDELIFGALIGRVEMVNCIHISVLEANAHVKPLPYFAEGPWCHFYEQRRPLKAPIPYRGMLGLWDAPAQLIERLQY